MIERNHESQHDLPVLNPSIPPSRTSKHHQKQSAKELPISWETSCLRERVEKYVANVLGWLERVFISGSISAVEVRTSELECRSWLAWGDLDVGGAETSLADLAERRTRLWAELGCREVEDV